MLRIARDYANSALSTFGLKIIRNDQLDGLLDLRENGIDPVEAYYHSQGRPFLMHIPIEKCFSIDFSCATSDNPFVQTLIAFRDGLCKSYRDSPLKDFYARWQPSASNYVDGNNKELAPPWDYGLKRDINLASARLVRNDFIKIRNELKISSTNIYGHISRGPVSDEFGEITFARLIKIYNSIKAYGYQPDKMKAEHISGSFFIHKDDYRVAISRGKHRITALQALGYKMIPIQFGPPKFPVIVRREEVDSWPNVRAGFYTKEAALKVFDKRFMTEHPSNWRWNNS